MKNKLHAYSHIVYCSHMYLLCTHIWAVLESTQPIIVLHTVVLYIILCADTAHTHKTHNLQPHLYKHRLQPNAQ